MPAKRHPKITPRLRRCVMPEPRLASMKAALVYGGHQEERSQHSRVLVSVPLTVEIVANGHSDECHQVTQRVTDTPESQQWTNCLMSAGFNSAGTFCSAMTAFCFCSTGRRCSAPSKSAAMSFGVGGTCTELLQTSLCVSVYVPYEFGCRTKSELRGLRVSSASELCSKAIRSWSFLLSSVSELSGDRAISC